MPAEYRSGIFTHTDEQLRIAHEVTEKIQAEHFTPKGKTIVTEIAPAGIWYDAEVGSFAYLSDLRLTSLVGVPPEVSG